MVMTNLTKTKFTSPTKNSKLAIYEKNREQCATDLPVVETAFNARLIKEQKKLEPQQLKQLSTQKVLHPFPSATNLIDDC